MRNRETLSRAVLLRLVMAVAVCIVSTSVAWADNYTTDTTVDYAKNEGGTDVRVYGDVELTVTGSITNIGGTVGIGSTSTELASLVIDGGTVGDQGAPEGLVVGWNGPGLLEITGGGTFYGNSAYVGYTANKVAAILLSSGTLSFASTLRMGYANCEVTYLQSGGSLTVTEASVYLGMASGSDSVMTISGGTVDIGKTLAIGDADAPGRFNVVGSAGTIGVNTSVAVGSYLAVYGTARSTLGFTLDDSAEHISCIESYQTNLGSGAVVDMGLDGFTPTYGQTFDLLKDLDGTIDISELVLSGEDTSEWQLITNVAGDTLQAQYIGAANEPPVADAGDDAGLMDDGDGSESVTLDGSGSSDDQVIVSYVWRENGSQIATGATPTVGLTVGKHDIQLTVTDGAAQTDTAVVRVWIAPQGDYFVDTNDPSASDSNPGTAALPFKTISKATSVVTAGDVIIVREGIYREIVHTAEVNGTESTPIVLMGYPLERVVLSGADPVTSWTQCTEQIAKGNSNYASIYYSDIAWQPSRVSQDVVDLQCAQTPATGAWIPTGGTSSPTKTLIDTANLTQADDYWNGASISMVNTSSGTTAFATVSDFDSASSTLTISSPYSWPTPDSQDGYVLSNKVELISGDGQWAAENMGGGTYRLFVWADGGGNPGSHLIEGSRRSHYKGNLRIYGSYWTVDNIEFRHYKAYSCIVGLEDHVTVQNCLFHHNDYMGVEAKGDYWTVRYSTSAYNKYGLCLAGDYNVLEYSEVGWNAEDGVRAWGPGGESWHTQKTIRNNYIHHHLGMNHPDNIQTYDNITNLLIEDCYVIGAVQNLMGQDVMNTTLSNDVVVGAQAYSLIIGSGDGTQTVEKTTGLFGGYGVYNCGVLATDQVHTDNITVKGAESGGALWSNVTGSSFSSDYNCLWLIEGHTRSPILWHGNSNDTWAEYLTKSGQDAHSFHADPLLTNVPTHFCMVDAQRRFQNTATRIYLVDDLDDDIGLFEVGDHIEVDWDGVVRTVTTVDTDDTYIEFTPGDDKFKYRATQIANWKEKTNYQLDVTPTAGSPAKDSASDAGNMGSNINLQNYAAGDFNGDGRRDVPDVP